jgi:hypothetical protein
MASQFNIIRIESSADDSQIHDEAHDTRVYDVDAERWDRKHRENNRLLLRLAPFDDIDPSRFKGGISKILCGLPVPASLCPRGVERGDFLIVYLLIRQKMR